MEDALGCGPCIGDMWEYPFDPTCLLCVFHMWVTSLLEIFMSVQGMVLFHAWETLWKRMDVSALNSLRVLKGGTSHVEQSLPH